MNERKKRLALIVENDPDAAAIFSEAIKSVGYETEIIATGDQALERLAVTTPSIVVLDLHLPHVTGPEVLRYIRAEPRLEQVQVIVATVDSRLADSVYDEATLVLLKPISFNQLRDLTKRFG